MDIAALLRKSAKSALFSWKQDEDGVEDLINDLWVWYLESPATQRKLQESDEPLARSLAYKAALQILAKNALSNDKFSGRNIYSSDSVRAALRGQSKNRYLVDILPRALKSLDAQNSGYAEALRSRYIDGTVPEVHSGMGYGDVEWQSHFSAVSMYPYTRAQFARNNGKVNCRFQQINCLEVYPSDWHRDNGFKFLRFELVALKGQRHPGLQHI